MDRPLIEELFSLAFVEDATNVILVGPNGVGKTMLVNKTSSTMVCSTASPRGSRTLSVPSIALMAGAGR